MTVHTATEPGLYLSAKALDALLPMHIWLDAEGRVLRVGPTMSKLAEGKTWIGKHFFSLAEIRRPTRIEDVRALHAVSGHRLGLRLSAMPDLQLRGQALSLPDLSGIVIDISFGVSFADAVEQRGLTLSDFSPCDQTVELLYLREAISAVAHESRNLTDRLIASEHAAQTRALTDALTGLANRRALDDLLFKLLHEPAAPFTLIHMDLDFFKQINDELGHAAGDAVLVRVAQVLRDEVREADVAARVGGDEFVIVLRNCDDPMFVERIAERLIDRLEEPIQIGNERCRISASVGSTRSSSYQRPDADQMLRDADLALYASKRAGRGRHSFFSSEMNSGAK